MKTAFETVSVVGLGYVGLPTAALIASRGIQVHGVDVDAETVELINRGQVPIVEPGLDVLVRGAVATGRLGAATTARPADAFIVAVPTPFAGDHQPDLSHLRAAAADMAPHLAKGNLIVIESTSPVGTTDAFAEWLAEARPDLSFPGQALGDADVQVAHSPERVLPGRVLVELVDNDRVVGGMSRHCAERAAALYGLFVNGACVRTTARTAEFVKLAENAYRDVNIAFANELSVVSERLGLDVLEVIELANRHPRVDVLRPGPGVGGHCIAVDPWFIVAAAPDDTALIRAARAVNDAMPARVAARVAAAAAPLEEPCIACLGLAYKADTDDLRLSPALAVVEALAARRSGRLLVVEPHIESLPGSLAGHGGVELADLDHALAAAGIVVLLTDHRAFRAVRRERLFDKTVFDTRGMWPPDDRGNA